MRENDQAIMQVEGLEIELVTEQGRAKVVDDLSFNLYRGKTMALVGESGCGKSVSALGLMHLLPSPPFLSPKGRIFFGGKELNLSSSKVPQGLAMIFQNPMTSLNPLLSIGQQLMQTAYVHVTKNEEEARTLAIEALNNVHISSPEKRLDDYPHQLSGGMRQRVLIALALITTPKVLIADEPTTALDLTVQRQVMELIDELKTQHNMAVLLISHDIALVGRYADEITVMYLSQCVEKGSKDDVLSSPKHPYTKGLLASQPSWQKRHEALLPIKGQVPSIFHIPQGCRFHPRCPFSIPKCWENKIEMSQIEKQEVRCIRAKEI